MSPEFTQFLASYPSEDPDWSLSNQKGREYADRVVEMMNDENNPTTLGRVAKAMIERGRYGGVEVGFFTMLAIHAMRGRVV